MFTSAWNLIPIHMGEWIRYDNRWMVDGSSGVFVEL